MNNEPLNLTLEESKTLVDLIYWAVNGTEHGVINYDAWKAKCQALKDFLKSKSYDVNWHMTN